MSTKINVRSPFYLNLTEPQKPLPLYDCSAAFPNLPNSGNFSVDNEGILTMPNPDFGTVFSYTSSAGDFSNGKFASVTTDTVRTVVFTLTIPSEFSNAADLYKTCTQTATQAGKTISVVQPSVCSGGPSTSGSIPAQTLNSGGSTVDINLSGYFTNETTYDVSNNNPLLITTALSGSTLTLISNAQGGSAVVYAIARDGSYPSTCEAVQAISVTVNATGVTWSCTFPANPALQGGSIAADGTLTDPQAAGDITSRKSGSCTGSTYSNDANGTGSARDVTIYFDIVVPNGYDNGGATVCCNKTFSQPPTSAPDPTFTCGIAGLTGQTISKNGAVNLGGAANGTVKSFTQPSTPFGTVNSITDRTIEFQIEIPNGFANSGTIFNCSKVVTQPANLTACSTAVNSFFLSTGKLAVGDFCDTIYSTPTPVDSSATSIAALLGTVICKGGNAFDGGNLYYGVMMSYVAAAIGITGRDYYAIQIDSSGIVTDVRVGNCQGSGGQRVNIQV
jgi:hypothetical protein